MTQPTQEELAQARLVMRRAGGYARAKKLSKKRRIEIAKKAGLASGKARKVSDHL